MKMYSQKKENGKIISTYINFGNEVFRVQLSDRGYWIMFRREKYPLPFTDGMWLLNMTFDSLKEAKKFIRDRKYYNTRLISFDQLP